MCLAIPGRILAIEENPGQQVGARIATVDFNGNRIEASLDVTPEAGVGDWVLVHAGFALAVLDEEEARETWDMLQEALQPGPVEPVEVRTP